MDAQLTNAENSPANSATKLQGGLDLRQPHGWSWMRGEGSIMLQVAVFFLIGGLVAGFYACGFVPDTSYTVAKVLAPVCLGFFVFFLHLFLRQPA